MHGFLGFLGTMILLLAMVNYAHADTGWDDAEGLRTRVMIATKVESPTLGLEQGNGKIEAVGDGADNAGVIGSSWMEHIHALVDSGYAESELQPDSLSVRTARRSERGTGKRVVKKLGAGALGGELFGFLLEQILVGLNRNGGNDFGTSFFFSRLLGYTLVTPVCVSRVDQHDHYISTLTGSLMGVMLLTRVVEIDSAIEEKSDMWALLASSVIGATIMSELSRYTPASSRLSLGVVPDRRGGLSTVAALRF